MQFASVNKFVAICFYISANYSSPIFSRPLTIVSRETVVLTMNKLSAEIGRNVRRYRLLKVLSLEQLAEILDTEPNYLGQCERGARRLGLDKLVHLISYFGVTPNDIIPIVNGSEENFLEKEQYLQEINEILEGCSANQLAVVINILRRTIPFLKD